MNYVTTAGIKLRKNVINHSNNQLIFTFAHPFTPFGAFSIHIIICNNIFVGTCAIKLNIITF